MTSLTLINTYQKFIEQLKNFDGIPSLLLRLYLAPIFIMAGYGKMQFINPEVTGLANFLTSPDIISWFGNAEWGLGLPFPTFLANIATWTEFFGGWLLLVGLFVLGELPSNKDITPDGLNTNKNNNTKIKTHPAILHILSIGSIFILYYIK